MEAVLKSVVVRSNELSLKSLVDRTHLVMDTIDTQKVTLAFKGWQIRSVCRFQELGDFRVLQLATWA